MRSCKLLFREERRGQEEVTQRLYKQNKHKNILYFSFFIMGLGSQTRKGCSEFTERHDTGKDVFLLSGSVIIFFSQALTVNIL